MTPPVPNYTHKATLDRVVDGDTYWLRLDLGTYAGVRAELVVDVRLEGIDVVEASSPTGAAATQHARDLLTGASAGRVPEIVVQTSKPDLSGPLGASFARTRGHVWVDGHDMADLMRSAGYEKRTAA